MRWTAVLAFTSLLLAGCAGKAPPSETFETGDDEAGRQSVPGSGSRERDNTTRVWEHQVTYAMDASPPATTMEVPTNVTDLFVRVVNAATAPCGANVGEGIDVLGPYAEFVSPSGNATQVGLSANECNVAGLAVYSGSWGVPLETEVGVWQVTFSGRGHGLRQTVIVEGQRT